VPIPRRKSSPSLLAHDSTDEEEEDLAATEEYLNLRRSSSYKGRSSTGEIIQEPVLPKASKKCSLLVESKDFCLGVKGDVFGVDLPRGPSGSSSTNS
jgi:hypothetical protein